MNKLKYLALLVLGLGILFPFTYLALLSFSGEWFFPEVLPGYFGLKNWKEILNSESGMGLSFISSLGISLLVATLGTGTGFIWSKSIAYHSQKETWLVLAYFPYMLSPVVLAACLNFFFLKSGFSGTWQGVVLGQYLVAFPYSVIFFQAFWNHRTRQFEQLVFTLGGSSRQAFVQVILPLAKGMILVCFFQTFLISWFEYGLTALVGVGKVQTLTVKVFLYIKEANFYYGAIASCLLVWPPVLLLYLNKRFVYNRLV